MEKKVADGMGSDVPIGVIGLGAMGLPIARRLLECGLDVVGYDIDPAPVSALAGHIHAASSPRDVADRAAIVLGCLPGNDAYNEALFGMAGAMGGTQMTHYIHLGTSGVAFVEDLASALAPRVVLLDAPIIGGARRALEGTLTIVVSGALEGCDHCRTVLEAMSARLFVVSERPGPAQMMKLINNILSSVNLAVACEALLVGVKAGLDPKTMLEVVNNGTGQSNATSTKVPLNLMTGEFDYGGALRIILKDSAAFLEQAELLGVPVDIARQARAAYLSAVEAVGEDGDMTEVIRPMEAKAGVVLRG